MFIFLSLFHLAYQFPNASISSECCNFVFLYNSIKFYCAYTTLLTLLIVDRRLDWLPSLAIVSWAAINNYGCASTFSLGHKVQ